MTKFKVRDEVMYCGYVSIIVDLYESSAQIITPLFDSPVWVPISEIKNID